MENDTPTIEEAFEAGFGEEESTPEVKSSEPEVQPEESVETESTEKEATEVEEKEESKETTKPEETKEEENFTKTRVEDLPDEIRDIYKSLQADYTRKRQSDSSKVKELEEQIEVLKSPKDQKPQKELSPEEQLKGVVKQTLLEEKESEWENLAKTEIEQIEPKLNENHPDFDSKFDIFARAQLDDRLEEYASKNNTKVGFDYKESIEGIKKDWDDYVYKINKSFVARQNKIAKEKQETLKKQNPPKSSSDSKPSGNLSLADSIDRAFQ